MDRTRQAELAAYEEWLRERRVAPDFKVPYFARWVERFLRLRDSRPREVWEDTLEMLLEDLAKGQFKPWQVRQAADAVTMYCGQFCDRMATRVAPKRHTANRPAAPGRRQDEGARTQADKPDEGCRGQAEKAPRSRGSSTGTGHSGTPMAGQDTPMEGDGDLLTHDRMLAEMRRLLRLRHYAPSTERSYLGWSRRFLRYVGRSGELVRLRVKDLDFEANTVTVRAGKGDKDRVTFLPKRLVKESET